eukprot:gene3062-30001_t
MGKKRWSVASIFSVLAKVPLVGDKVLNKVIKHSNQSFKCPECGRVSLIPMQECLRSPEALLRRGVIGELLAASVAARDEAAAAVEAAAAAAVAKAGSSDAKSTKTSWWSRKDSSSRVGRAAGTTAAVAAATTLPEGELPGGGGGGAEMRVVAESSSSGGGGGTVGTVAAGQSNLEEAASVLAPAPAPVVAAVGGGEGGGRPVPTASSAATVGGTASTPTPESPLRLAALLPMPVTPTSTPTSPPPTSPTSSAPPVRSPRSPLPPAQRVPVCDACSTRPRLGIHPHENDSCGGDKQEFVRLAQVLFRLRPNLVQLPEGLDPNLLEVHHKYIVHELSLTARRSEENKALPELPPGIWSVIFTFIKPTGSCWQTDKENKAACGRSCGGGGGGGGGCRCLAKKAGS